ncbi:TIGR04222 domain-containing membrane protein, partial [Streptomyces sp. T-3]|nr:TIGR04222 domain-containing membrane protein [Streptomyces sp. T-3]
HAGSSTVAGAVRQVKAAALAVLVLGGAAVLFFPDEQGSPVAAWFALPLVLTLGCLAIARFEVHPYTRWASPAGQRLLGSLAPDPAGDDRDYLTTVAVRGVQGVRDPELRAAFSNGKASRGALGKG